MQCKNNGPQSWVGPGSLLDQIDTLVSAGAHVSAGLTKGQETRPEWIRLPKAGAFCLYSGLSRSGLNELILPCPANNFKPPVQSISLRKRGALRGTRLISYDSLMKYLNSLLPRQI